MFQKQNSYLRCASLQVWMISFGSEWIEYVWSKHSVPWIIIINIQSKVGKGRQFVTPPCDPLFLINQNDFAQWPGSMGKFLRNSGFVNVPRNSVRKAFLYAWGMVLSTGIKGSRVHPLGFILSDILILKQLKHTPLLNKECRNFEITWLDLRKDSHFNACFSFTWLWNSSSRFLELIYGKMSCLLCKCPAHCAVIPHWPIASII